MPVSLPSIEQVAAQLTANKGVTAPAAPAPAPAVDAPPIDPAVVAASIAPPATPAADVSADVAIAPEVTTDVAPEVVAEPAPAPEPKKDPAAARFAALSRRERDIRQREQEIQARADAADKRAKDAEDLAAKVKGAKRPVEAMRALGYTMEDITMDALGSYKPKELDPVDAKLLERMSPVELQLAEARAQLEQQKKIIDEIQLDRAEVAKRQVRADIVNTAKDKGHEIIQAIGEDAVTLVQHVISEYYKTNGTILSYETACDNVEKHYADYITSVVDRTTKFKTQIAPGKPTPPAKSPAGNQAKPAPTTLTQSLSQGTSAKTVDLDKMSKTDALQYLAKTIQYAP